MDAPELLPCPFCGATNIEPDYMNTPFGLECKSCGASGPPDSYQDPDEAAAAWNTRADLVDQMIAEAVAKERKEWALQYLSDESQWMEAIDAAVAREQENTLRRATLFCTDCGHPVFPGIDGRGSCGHGRVISISAAIREVGE